MKIQRLKGRNAIDLLFREGNVIKQHAFLLRYKVTSIGSDIHLGISVPKSKFDKAVDRNRIKRQLRTLVRQEGDILFHGLEGQGLIGMLLYLDEKERSNPQIKKCLIDLFDLLRPNNNL
jgi:ribonuclease P protein component|tara:strand:+ start:989 stop:1345 length:357 start_codon:yes stop_codon:yes gene_type:complete